ncbi:MerR family transcriptional regulator [Pseudorhodobacter ferrugineus]|uniref:MerR family transcriptional regulator n=1 Tax=Pseudorhodobacter ferrugineus TaxID=77008 RepID=UPI0003B5F30F|nr:MerR family transcriptional regulator [Pseudorhodobacter ferrugineus]
MDKSPDAFRTISEVAELLETPAHVLRFWESRFPQIKPVKRAGGRRYYRPADMALLVGIRRLLHDEGLTIRGVQKILREQGVRHVCGMAEDVFADEVDLDVVDDEVVPTPERAGTPIALFPNARGSEVPDTAAAEAPLDSAAATADDEAKAARLTQVVEDISADEGIDEAALYAALEGQIEGEADLADAEDVAAEPSVAVLAARDEVVLSESQGIETEAEPKADPQENLFAAPNGQSGTKTENAPQMPEKSVTDGAERDVAEGVKADEPVTTTAPQPALPGPMPAPTEISGHWLAADIRTLRAGAFGEKRPQADVLFKRLVALRNRVGDLGRVPRR